MSPSTFRYFLAWAAIWTVACLRPAESALAEIPGSQQPAFKVDVGNPTADKPQSKLWFANDSWWAWLPTRDGSSVWRRTAAGWRRVESLDEPLRGLRGRADIWHSGETVRAVLVDGRRLDVVTLRYSKESGYQLVGTPVQFEPHGGGQSDVIETATIASDSRGRWWIAYPWQRRMWVRATRNVNATEWTEPIAVSDETDADDLCALMQLPKGVGLAWSNQATDTMNFRLHQDDAEAEYWEPLEEIERGSHNADDHINAKVTSDGAVLLATKNSVDRIGEAQLVLRVRHPNGRWESIPYARREPTAEPSRPMLLLSVDRPDLVLLHTLYGRSSDPQQKPRNTIVWQTASLASLNREKLGAAARILINPGAAVNNVTGCKAPLPTGIPWIVLASDVEGNIYEGQIELTAIHPNPTGKSAR